MEDVYRHVKNYWDLNTYLLDAFESVSTINLNLNGHNKAARREMCTSVV